uniref:ATP-binding protein n=1 Tax=Candidatus Fimivicinus sp. TaxID=3056640 RepID=UPI003FEE80F3
EEYREYIEAWMHEVKTPLAAAKLTLENDTGSVPVSVSDDLRRIEDYLEQALFYARSGSVEKDYLIRPVSLRELVNASVRRNAKDMIASKIGLTLENLDFIVLTDVKWTDFILNQIFVNAIKYRSASPSIRLYAKQEKNGVSLLIEDNGIGIRQADLPRVFDRGFTGETGRKFSKATGLGLYLSKRLCDKIGLGISVFSIEGKGTTVRLIFPSGTMHDLSKDT